MWRKIFCASVSLLLCSVPRAQWVNTGVDTIPAYMDRQIAGIVAQIQEPVIPENEIDLAGFSGHKADGPGSHDFCHDIKRAIDSLDAMGGGKLIFSHSQGKYAWIKSTETYRVKGPIVLKSNIELTFYPNVKLAFEFDPASYLPDGKPVLRRYEGTTLYSYCPLIYAFNAENVAITFSGGNGAMPVIHGDGERWQQWSYEGNKKSIANGDSPGYEAIRTELNEADVPIAERIRIDQEVDFLRPTMMEFFHCRRVKVEGVKLVSSPFWVVHPVFTREMIMRKVMFDCQVVNNDGIDIESSSYVLVEDVIFDNHDDNVVIKSGRDREGREGALVAGSELEHVDSSYIKDGRITAPTEHVVVRNCVFKGHNGICIGSEASAGANNIFVTDCHAPLDVKIGVFMKSSRKRGGLITDVYLRNLKFSKLGNDVICIIPNYDNDSTSAYPPLFRDIHISNVWANIAGRGVRVFGWEDAPIENVTIEDVTVKDVIRKKEKDLFLINQVKNVRMKNVRIEGKLYDGVYSKKENGAIPPKQG